LAVYVIIFVQSQFGHATVQVIFLVFESKDNQVGNQDNEYVNISVSIKSGNIIALIVSFSVIVSSEILGANGGIFGGYT